MAHARAEPSVHSPSCWPEQPSQTESGGGTSENPDVTDGLADPIVSFAEIGVFVLSPIQGVLSGVCGGDNLDDGDVGAGQTSDGLYSILERDGSLTLEFGSSRTVTSIAIYGGYVNRDDGDYSLYDDQGSLIGSWTVSTPLGSPPWTNDRVDSYWMRFKTPVQTTSLRIDCISSEVGSDVRVGNHRAIAKCRFSGRRSFRASVDGDSRRSPRSPSRSAVSLSCVLTRGRSSVASRCAARSESPKTRVSRSRDQSHRTRRAPRGRRSGFARQLLGQAGKRPTKIAARMVAILAIENYRHVLTEGRSDMSFTNPADRTESD